LAPRQREPFEGIERVFGHGGLMLFVFVVAALNGHPDWSKVGEGFVLYRILDLQLVDVDGRRCGKVTTWSWREPLRATALLSGTARSPTGCRGGCCRAWRGASWAPSCSAAMSCASRGRRSTRSAPRCGCGARRSTSGSGRATTSSRR